MSGDRRSDVDRVLGELVSHRHEHAGDPDTTIEQRLPSAVANPDAIPTEKWGPAEGSEDSSLAADVESHTLRRSVPQDQQLTAGHLGRIGDDLDGLRNDLRSIGGVSHDRTVRPLSLDSAERSALANERTADAAASLLLLAQLSALWALMLTVGGILAVVAAIVYELMGWW